MSIFRSISPDSVYGNIVIGTTAVELKVGSAMLPNRTGIMIANADDVNKIFIGTDASVTANNGFLVLAGESIFLEVVPTQKLYAISDASNVDVRLIELK